MRHNQNRRSRGRSRKGPNPLTRSYESNGPDVKVRGNAAHVAEKYMTLARDAQSSGDPVAAENYLQHAEHYNRIVQAAQAQFQQSQPQFREGGEEGYDDGQMNGGPRDRFDFNGGGRDDEGGDDRFDSNEGDDDRGYRPMQSRQGGEQSNDRDRGDRQQQQRGPRNDRNDRYDNRRDRDYRDNREGRDRSEQRFQRQDEPQPEGAQQAEAEAAPAPAAEEVRSPARKRRGRPPRNENGDAATEDTTPDGAAALAAFPD